ncbi:MAG TPA: hypothetical protein VME70_01065, partial [Mycobacteriales bacterium]|nr:hypothetical protein [Mycobacteriales bacterium]
MHAIDLIIGLGWIVFWVGWLAAAVATRSGRSNWGRYAGLRFVFILLILLAGRGRSFRHTSTHSPVMAGVGLAMFFLGLAVAVWARVNLGRN